MRAADLLIPFNPWWAGNAIPEEHLFEHRRFLYHRVERLAFSPKDACATVVHGPRRAGKTVLLKQLIGSALSSGRFPSQNVIYAPMQHSFLNGVPLWELAAQIRKASVSGKPVLLALDEIQFRPGWEDELKDLAGNSKGTKAVACASIRAEPDRIEAAGEADGLRRFQLPPLLFCEHLDVAGKWPSGLPKDPGQALSAKLDHDEVKKLNEDFVDYVNYGAVAETIRPSGPSGSCKAYRPGHVPDNELFNSYASLCGISNPAGLFALFGFVARNNCREITMESARSGTGLDHETAIKYLDYLEGCCLIRQVPKLGSAMRRLRRNPSRKCLLVHPSMHGLFNGPVSAGKEGFKNAVEAAVFTQFVEGKYVPGPYRTKAYYCSYRRGSSECKADMVLMSRKTSYLNRMCQVTWSDDRDELERAAGHLSTISKRKRKAKSYGGSYCTTKSTYGEGPHGNVAFLPTSQFSAALGLESMQAA